MRSFTVNQHTFFRDRKEGLLPGEAGEENRDSETKMGMNHPHKVRA
jgi:hypothetical protein